MAGFSTPLGLLALASLIPLILLYIFQPDPRRLRVPTTEFLPNVDEDSGSNPVLEKLRRNLLLLVQILALVLLALALGSPFVQISKSEAADQTVIVLDATASMGVEEGGQTRFDRAVRRAAEEVTSSTSVVVVGSTTRVPVQEGSAGEARNAIRATTVTDADGSLASGIARASAMGNSDTRLVVVSDFSGDSDWKGAIQQARAKGLVLELAQYAGGGGDNVGIVDLSFSEGLLTVEVGNFGDSNAEREVSLGGASETVRLGPGSFDSVTFSIPPGGGTVSLSPSDSFATDDEAYVAGHESDLRVLVVTNERNRFLDAAFSAMGDVKHEVREPPLDSFDGTRYDVVVFGNVEPDRLLSRTVRSARDAVSSGGGVIIRAHEGLTELQGEYGNLLVVEPGGVVPGEGVSVVSNSEMVRNIEFPPPRRYVEAELRFGRTFVETAGGDPFIASGRLGDGTVMYYGYIDGASDFSSNVRFPVFWRDALYHAANRERLSSLNRETGNTLSFANETTVSTPGGRLTGPSVVMQDAGFYGVGSKRYSANLLSAAESDVGAEAIEETEASVTARRTQEERVPLDVTPHTAVLVLLVVFGELGIMRYRGDI